MKEKDKRRDARGEARERAKGQRERLGKYFYDLKSYESIDISFRGNAIDTCGVYRLDVHAIRQALVG